MVPELPPRLARSAAYEAIEMRKLVPDGSVCFGGKRAMRRRGKGLIDRNDLHRARLRPLACLGEAHCRGNLHFRIDPEDTSSLTVRLLDEQEIVLTLTPPRIRSKWARLLPVVAKMAADGKLAVTFRIDDTHLHVTFNPKLVKGHPEAKPKLLNQPERWLGIDLNPEAIGVTVVDVKDRTPHILDWKLFRLVDKVDRSKTDSRQHLSYIAESTVAFARHRKICGIAIENLANLPTSNGCLNRWARNYFQSALRRYAALAEIRVMEVPGAYSTTVGNILHDLPDACASASEIARRGESRSRGIKEILPVFERNEALRGVVAATRGNNKSFGTVDCASSRLGTLTGWAELHGKLKQAKIGVRRPHPVSHRRRRSSLPGVGAKLVPRSLKRLTMFGPLLKPLATNKTGFQGIQVAEVQAAGTILD